jgi:AcrR family transcriptional regulator
MTVASTSRAPSRSATRNPGRSQERILAAAFKEFATHGFAGARVDEIARRAGINKRMLYHYFGDKEALFREVLRRKLAERQAWGVSTPDAAQRSLPYWFALTCRDMDWIRLLEWEALQFFEKPLIDESKRREAAAQAVQRIRGRQARGHLTRQFDAPQVLLAMMALTTFPLAFPQLTRLITGQRVSQPAFRKKYTEFLREFAQAFEDRESIWNGKARLRFA